MRLMLSNQLVTPVLRLLGLALLVVTTAKAATLSDEEETLARLEQTLENRQTTQQDIENDLLGDRTKATEAQADLEQAKQELVTAEAELTAARQAFSADAGQENSRALKKAEHSHKMAERGVRTRTKRLERVDRNLKESEAKLAATKKAIASLRSQIASQRQRLSEVAASLKAQADQDATAAAVTRVDSRPTPQPPKAPAKPVAPEPKPVEPPQPAAVAAKALQAPPAAAPKQVIALDQEALAYARGEMSRLESFLADGQPGRPSYRRLVLRGSKVQAVAFEFLGRDQYRAEVPVAAGKQQFEIGSHKFRRTIPASDDGEMYVFIYDAKRLSRPRLAIFRKSLLEHL
ncbi:hypothetical protein FKG94_17140 [Exilibacterium tricleocarpae]|uniref:Chromosome partition protein Smc n=1 Tax=Exilibacterium tricleocarpae TaxID=2591008 RepID=A0A545T888_9GAMM|nr:hypothetical protein [Exilibacterium tricleocarpae]TQV73429.1 hypothetical protein FKG94_17140 [Exilibacterium tricleocarpae]